MRRAAVVVVGSDALADYAHQAGAKRVHLVYSAVDSRRFAQAAECQPARFTVGWIGTPMTADQSLHVLRKPLKQFLAETGAAAAFVGMAANQFPDIPGVRVPWSESAEIPFLADIAVGLCPLDDSPWTRGKSGYKIIQYMSAGRATLTSPVGIAAQLVRPGETGLHCRSADEWYRGLSNLHNDRAQCAAFGRAARDLAVRLYDTRAAADALHDILRAAARP
jgi:glycosyltransferase involved in cell wall biosynthesis